MATNPATSPKPRTGATLRDASTSFADRHGLTTRERDVVFLLASGVAHVADLAALLTLRPNTVHNHLKGIFRRTRTRSKSELLAALLLHALERTDLSARLYRRPQVLLLDQCRGLARPLGMLGMRVHEGSLSQLDLSADARVDVAVAGWLDPVQAETAAASLRAQLGENTRVLFAGNVDETRTGAAEGSWPLPMEPMRIAFEILVLLSDDPYARSRLKRTDGDLPAMIDRRLSTRITNVGFGGAFVVVPAAVFDDPSAMRVGELMELSFSLRDEQPVRARATVVWTRPSPRVSAPSGVGVKFTDVTPEDQTRLEDFVRHSRMEAMMAAVSHVQRPRAQA